MKIRYIGMVLGLLLVLSTAIVYAHGKIDLQSDGDNNHRMMFQNIHEFGDDMDEMHERMTANLDPELKQEMDEMHESCMSGNFEDDHESNDQKINTELEQEMDEMHERMTANLDPELKQEMDEMHESCMSGNFEDDHESNDQKTNTEISDDMMDNDVMGGMMR